MEMSLVFLVPHDNTDKLLPNHGAVGETLTWHTHTPEYEYRGQGHGT